MIVKEDCDTRFHHPPLKHSPWTCPGKGSRSSRWFPSSCFERHRTCHHVQHIRRSNRFDQV